MAIESAPGHWGLPDVLVALSNVVPWNDVVAIHRGRIIGNVNYVELASPGDSRPEIIDEGDATLLSSDERERLSGLIQPNHRGLAAWLAAHS